MDRLKYAEEEIWRLRTDLYRYLNPWTVEVQSVSGQWLELAHDSPLSLVDAEERLRQHKEESPRATFRMVPWLNGQQIQAVNAKLSATLAALEKCQEHLRTLGYAEAEVYNP